MTQPPNRLILSAICLSIAGAVTYCGSGSKSSSSSAGSGTGSASATGGGAASSTASATGTVTGAATGATTTGTGSATGTTSATEAATATATGSETGTADGSDTETGTGTSTGTANAFDVTTPGFFYAVTDGAGTAISGNNPNLTVTHGQTYTFHVKVDSVHPFLITTDQSGATPFTGATNNNISTGDLTLTLPATGSPATLYYRCSIHGFGGTITVQ